MIAILFPCVLGQQNLLTFMILWLKEVRVIVACQVESDRISNPKQQPPELQDNSSKCVYSVAHIGENISIDFDVKFLTTSIQFSEFASKTCLHQVTKDVHVDFLYT